MVKVIKIDNSDIFLESFGDGKGKITISNTEGYNYSHYWGAMGDNLETFLTKINKEYFSMKLKPDYDMGDFDAKLSVRSIRKFIKDEFSYDLPWYKFTEFQKELRHLLKDIEKYSYSEEDFVRRCSDIPNNVWLSLDFKAEKEFVEIMKTIFQEPWNFIVKSDSKNVKFLEDLLPKIQKKIKNEGI